MCLGTVLAGSACLVMARKFSTSNFWSDIRASKATSFSYVGELCRYLMDQPETAQDKQHSVRLIMGNGMRPSIRNDFKQRFGISQVIEFYRSNEGNINFTNLLNLEKIVGFTTLLYAIVKYDRETDQPHRDINGNMVKVKKGKIGLLIGKISDKAPFHGYTDESKTQACVLETSKYDLYFLKIK